MSFLDSRIFVILFSLPRKTLGLHNVIINISLDFISHFFNSLQSLQFSFCLLYFLNWFLITYLFFLALIHTISLHIYWLYITELFLFYLLYTLLELRVVLNFILRVLNLSLASVDNRFNCLEVIIKVLNPIFHLSFSLIL